ncbi:hypothetical protein AGMMS50239_39350 [Bacteroidia bacterium]|nr:hypothetical protein AGMMS50239_39350 [Bacteroidia bacterium]GHV30398.1 hypothetical protein FACS1894177_02910 [Bacteroidia bacterium]
MAYMNKNIPVLEGEQAIRLQNIMDEAYANRKPFSKKEMNEHRKYIQESAKFFKKYKWDS